MAYYLRPVDGWDNPSQLSHWSTVEFFGSGPTSAVQGLKLSVVVMSMANLVPPAGDVAVRLGRGQQPTVQQKCGDPVLAAGGAAAAAPPAVLDAQAVEPVLQVLDAPGLRGRASRRGIPPGHITLV
jgi:hypothetical protein